MTLIDTTGIGVDSCDRTERRKIKAALDTLAKDVTALQQPKPFPRLFTNANVPLLPGEAFVHQVNGQYLMDNPASGVFTLAKIKAYCQSLTTKPGDWIMLDEEGENMRWVQAGDTNAIANHAMALEALHFETGCPVMSYRFPVTNFYTPNGRSPALAESLMATKPAAATCLSIYPHFPIFDAIDLWNAMVDEGIADVKRAEKPITFTVMGHYFENNWEDLRYAARRQPVAETLHIVKRGIAAGAVPFYWTNMQDNINEYEKGTFAGAPYEAALQADCRAGESVPDYLRRCVAEDMAAIRSVA